MLVRGLDAGRKEKLFAIDLVGCDRVEARFRRQPFVPYARFVELYLRPLGGVYQDTAVRIEQGGVAIDENFEVLPVTQPIRIVKSQ